MHALSRIVTILLLLIIAEHGAIAATRIGAFLFSGETRYVESYNGFKDRMQEAGFREPDTVFTLENANANKATALEIVNRFAASKATLFFTVGTSASTALARQIADRPIVFSVIYDPIRAGIAKDWKSSQNNTTGISSQVPMQTIIAMLKELRDVKRMSVLYTPGEINSELVVRDLIAVQQQFGFSVTPVPLSREEDFPRVLPAVMRGSDAVYVSGSNMVNSQMAIIVREANKARTVTISHLEDLVEKGLMLGVCADPYQMGRLAADKAIKILGGAQPSSIPIDTARDTTVTLNMKTVADTGIAIPASFMKKVKRKIE